MFVYRIQERWDGKIDKQSQYYDRVYSRAFASTIAKSLFKKNWLAKLTKTDLESFADEPYLVRRRYQVLVIYDDQ